MFSTRLFECAQSQRGSNQFHHFLHKDDLNQLFVLLSLKSWHTLNLPKDQTFESYVLYFSPGLRIHTHCTLTMCVFVAFTSKNQSFRVCVFSLTCDRNCNYPNLLAFLAKRTRGFFEMFRSLNTEEDKEKVLIVG